MADTCLGFDRTKAEHNWGELVEVLNKEGIPIFTTNYDFAIEEIAENHGIDIIDNFKTGRLNRKFWDHSLTSFNNKGLLIVKLHGSVDWYTTKDRKDIEKLEQRVLKNRDGKRVDRVAIFPTRFKDIYESYFFSLYLKLISMLDTSHTVIVIGHSLRDEYIRAALRECFRKPTFNLIYLGPSYPKELSDLEVAGKDPKLQTIFISEKFENYANTLAYVIRKYNKNEVSQVLREITDFGKKSRITFSTKITWVKVGQEIEGIIKVLAPAIPPAILKAKLVQKSETSDEEVYIEVLDKKGGNQTIIEGIAEKEFNIWFTIPSEIAKGDYSFWFELHNEKGVIIADKDYICKVAGTKDNEEESITKEQQESINLLDEEVISHDNPDPIMDQEGEIN